MGYLSDEIKRLKRVNGMTSKVLAAEAGVSQALIEQICAGNRAASVAVLLSIARALSAEPQSLICAKMADELDESVRDGTLQVDSELYKDAFVAIERFRLWSGSLNQSASSHMDRAYPVKGLAELLGAGLCVLRFSEMKDICGESVFSADFVTSSEQLKANGGIYIDENGKVSRVNLD